ncbi:hypothetical protein JCM3770_003180 [Rhodotorula araucariae]
MPRSSVQSVPLPAHTPTSLLSPTATLHPRPRPAPAAPAPSASASASSHTKPSALARLRSFFRSSPSQDSALPSLLPAGQPPAAPLQKEPSAGEARPRPRMRPATATGTGEAAARPRPRSMLFGGSFAVRGSDGGTEERQENEERNGDGKRSARWRMPFGARPATATGATSASGGMRQGSFAALARAPGALGPVVPHEGRSAPALEKGMTTTPASSALTGWPSTAASTTALPASAFCRAPASPSSSHGSTAAATASRRPSTATTAQTSVAPSRGTSASASSGGLPISLSFRKAAAPDSHDGGLSRTLRRFADGFSPSPSSSPSASRAPQTHMEADVSTGRGSLFGSPAARSPLGHSPDTPVKSFLAPPPVPLPPAPAEHDSPPASSADPLTDAELASWRAAGQAKRATGGTGTIASVRQAHGALGPLGERIQSGIGARRGSAESEVLIIGNGGARTSEVPLAPSADPSMRSSTTSPSVPFGSSPRAFAVPPSPSPRLAASPFPSDGRRPSDSPSVTFALSRRTSDSPALVSSSRRPSHSPALPFGSRRPSAASGRSGVRPKTAPAGRPSPKFDAGALNVLEFVAVDAGRDGEASLPLHFPQTNGGGLDGLAPSAISPFPGSASPATPHGHFRRRLSTASSNLSLGSEEDMILSTLAATGASPSPDAGAGSGPLFAPSPGSSPVLGARPFLAPKPPPQSSLPPSMQRLFASPVARARPQANATLSAPSKRAALPTPIRISASVSSSATFGPTGAGLGLGVVVPATPPPRPPRAPRHSLPRAMPQEQEQKHELEREHSAWSPLRTLSSSAVTVPPRRGKTVRPRTAPAQARAPTPVRPSRSEERARAAAAAALEGRRESGGEEGKSAPGAWTPPPTPPGSGEIA